VWLLLLQKKPKETAKQSETHHNPKENEQPQKTANLLETNVELEKQETAKQSETLNDPEEQEQPQKTATQSEIDVNLEEEEQPQKDGKTTGDAH